MGGSPENVEQVRHQSNGSYILDQCPTRLVRQEAREERAQAYDTAVLVQLTFPLTMQ
jgi:hypothetical protein